MQIKARCVFYQENIWKFLARHSTHKWHTICKPKLTIEDLLCKFLCMAKTYTKINVKFMEILFLQRFISRKKIFLFPGFGEFWNCVTKQVKAIKFMEKICTNVDNFYIKTLIKKMSQKLKSEGEKMNKFSWRYQQTCTLMTQPREPTTYHYFRNYNNLVNALKLLTCIYSRAWKLFWWMVLSLFLLPFRFLLILDFYYSIWVMWK